MSEYFTSGRSSARRRAMDLERREEKKHAMSAQQPALGVARRFKQITKGLYLRVSLRGKDVNEGVRVTVEGDGRGGFEEFAVEGGQNPDDIVGACR